MKNETKTWLAYSIENFSSAEILIESKLFNPCLQNIQQCVEKSLKALLIEKGIKLERTHSISELHNILIRNKIEIEITEDDCDFLDAIYLPSKYPLSSVLPFYEANEEICIKGLKIADSILNEIKSIL